jgi:hypothetical protein
VNENHRDDLAAGASSETVQTALIFSELARFADNEYVRGCQISRRDECLGWEHKAATGKFGKREYDAHAEVQRAMGAHFGIYRAIAQIRTLVQAGNGAAEAPRSDKAVPNPDVSAYIASLVAENELLKADQRRFNWYFSDKPKGDWLMTYLDGMKTGWTTDEWRAAIDKALSAKEPT